MAIKKKAVKRKTATKPGAGLAKYRAALKKGTSVITKKVLEAEKKLKALKTEKAKKIKILRKKLKK